MKNKLSIAILPKDDYSKKIIKDECEIRILGLWKDTEPVRHHSGYYLFTNLPEGSYSATIKSRRYLDYEDIYYVKGSVAEGEEETYHLPKAEALLNPVEPPTEPAPTEPAPTEPASTEPTIISGKVIDSGTNSPIPGAKVLVETRDDETISDENGEYEIILDTNTIDPTINLTIDEIRLRISKDGYGYKRPAKKIGDIALEGVNVWPDTLLTLKTT